MTLTRTCGFMSTLSRLYLLYILLLCWKCFAYSPDQGGSTVVVDQGAADQGEESSSGPPVDSNQANPPTPSPSSNSALSTPPLEKMGSSIRSFLSKKPSPTKKRIFVSKYKCCEINRGPFMVLFWGLMEVQKDYIQLE